MNAPVDFPLTVGQQAALDAIYKFLLDPVEVVFVLAGYSGCGKSTLVKTLLDKLPSFWKTISLINPDARDYTVELTATTNKAAENLALITGQPVSTIYSFLGLRVNTDFRTGKTTLIPRNQDLQENYLLFIDEASYIDHDLLALIVKRTRNCKIIFVGDKAQLLQVKATTAPVFEAGFPMAELTEVVRQPKKEGGGLEEMHPITALAEKFRHTVNTGEWPTFVPDGKHIIYLGKDDFLKSIEQEFTRPDWRYRDSKILGWTNKCVIGYNQYVRNQVKGDPNLQAGDYAICNSFVTQGKSSVKTDDLVLISHISDDITKLGVLGNDIQVNGSMTFFMPKSLESKNARLRKAKTAEDFRVVATIETNWIDLRPAFSNTINKAQGSTYDAAYIDLDDVSRCNNGDQLARMMYVGVSRARHRLILTGDLA
jgi:energy-coupling factor transporter ATP-binding protein EcfA2